MRSTIIHVFGYSFKKFGYQYVLDAESFETNLKPYKNKIKHMLYTVFNYIYTYM